MAMLGLVLVQTSFAGLFLVKLTLKLRQVELG